MANSSLQTNGLILKEMKVSENDRLITVLTSDLGVIRAFSSGSLKMTSKGVSATAFLSYSRLNIHKSRNDTYRISDAQTEKIFWELRKDFKLLSLASYFCEICMHIAPKDEPAPEFLRLILNCLHLLSLKDKSIISPETVKAVFELRCCLYAGFMPDVTVCHGCGEPLCGNCRFDVNGGVFYCENCANNAEFVQKMPQNYMGILKSVPSGALAAMRHILYSPLEKCFGFKISGASEKSLFDICESFLQAQAGKSFDTLRFYKTYSL